MMSALRTDMLKYEGRMKKLKSHLKNFFFFICGKSLEKAAREQNLDGLSDKLKNLVPDIKDQYTTFKLESGYDQLKARIMHAFQMSLVNKVIDKLQKATIVDIGDSAGTHLKYIMGLHAHNKDIKTLSVNMDSEAIERIKAKGLKALRAKAEDMENLRVNADIVLCFQTLEHLMDPCRFLHQLSKVGGVKYAIVTVPYLRRSRVGLYHIRQNRQDNINAERTHIFELSTKDWKLIMRHAGWDIAEERVYFQYPKTGLFRITQPLWKKFDFEGFYGMILKKDDKWSSKYPDW